MAVVFACTLVVLLSPVCSGQDRLDCLPWEKEATNESTCECRNDLPQQMQCRAGVLYLDVKSCLTYDQTTLYEASCHYLKLHSYYNSTSIRVPTNLSEINSFFCSPLNRMGLVCSQCKQGYGVSFLTAGLKCVKCSSPLRGWILYLVVQFLPVTLFYILIFVLQISVTFPPMLSFVMYSQFIVLVHTPAVIKGIFMHSTPLLRNVISALFTLYEPWNLDFGTHLFPAFCISPSIKDGDIFLLRYIPEVYFLFLIVLTYFAFKLNNFQCQLRAVQRCFQPVRSCMGSVRVLINPQASIVDVLTTLFILSCAKNFTNSLLVLKSTYLRNITAQPPTTLRIPFADASYSYRGAHQVICMTIAAIMLSLLAATLLLLACYPFRLFRRALAFTVRSKLQYLNMLVEKFQGHYKDGTNGTRDLRIFSLFYFVLLVVLELSPRMIRVEGSLNYMVRGILLFVSSVIILVVRPYKAEHLSAYDGVLLVLLGIQSILIDLKVHLLKTYFIECLWLLAVTMALPQLALIAYILKVVAQFVVSKCKKRHRDVEIMDNRFVSSPEQNTGYCKRGDGNKEGASLTEKTPLLS